MCRGTPWASIKPQEYLHFSLKNSKTVVAIATVPPPRPSTPQRAMFSHFPVGLHLQPPIQHCHIDLGHAAGVKRISRQAPWPKFGSNQRAVSHSGWSSSSPPSCSPCVSHSSSILSTRRSNASRAQISMSRSDSIAPSRRPWSRISSPICWTQLSMTATLAVRSWSAFSTLRSLPWPFAQSQLYPSLQSFPLPFAPNGDPL